MSIIAMRVAFLLGLGTLAAVALRHLLGYDDAAALTRDVAGQLDELRDHLFKR